MNLKILNEILAWNEENSFVSVFNIFRMQKKRKYSK
jgi:hypothetical protein